MIIIFFIWQGFAYVPREELVSLVANEFRMRLSRALAVSVSCVYACVIWDDNNLSGVTIVQLQKISILLPLKNFCFKPRSPPLSAGNSSLFSYTSSNNLPFIKRPPPPWNFQWPSMGWVWIFSGTTHFNILRVWLFHFERVESWGSTCKVCNWCYIFVPLQVTARALPYLEEDERLLPKLTNLRLVT